MNVKTDTNPDSAILLQTSKVKDIAKNDNETNNNPLSDSAILLQTSIVKRIAIDNNKVTNKNISSDAKDVAKNTIKLGTIDAAKNIMDVNTFITKMKASNTLKNSAVKVITNCIAKRPGNTLRIPAAAVYINSNNKNDLDHEKFMRYMSDVRGKKTKLDVCDCDKASWIFQEIICVLCLIVLI